MDPSPKAAPRPQPNRSLNIGSRIFHCFLIVLFLAVLVLSVISLGSFAYKYREINHDTIYHTDANGRCILYAHYDKKLYLGTDGHCLFAMGAEGAVALVAAVFIAVLVIKTCAGFSAIKFCVCTAVDLVVVVVLLLLSLAVGIDIAIGLGNTCDAAGKDQKHADRCNGYKLRDHDDKLKVTFYDQIFQAGLTALLGAAFLFVIFLVYAILLTCYCCKRRQSGNSEEQRLLGSKTGESETHTPFS